MASPQQQATDRPSAQGIQRRFVFGARSDVKDGLHYLDENTVCWAAGKNVVIYNTQYATQKFIACGDSCESITAMAISANRKAIAVAESGDTPCIAIYDVATRKRKRALQVPDLGSKEFVSLAFSNDGRFLVSQGGFPEWNLVYWNIEKSKALAIVNTAEKTAASQDRRCISQCSFSPRDPTLMCVSGNGILKFFRFVDGQLRQAPGGMGKGEPLNYLAHLWLSPEERMIVSTDNGDLLLLENYEYKYPLPLSPSDGLSIDTLISHSKGFIAGGDMGLLTIFERSEDKELFRKTRTLKVDSDKKDADGTAAVEDSTKIVAFTLTPPPSEEYLAMMTSTKQLYFLNLSNADFSKADDHVCDYLAQPFHAGPITGLDVCIRKPLIVTCGKDRNIFLWNYNTNTVEVVKHFSSEVLSVAMHPTGLHLLVGFPDKLRFMNIYGDDIREFKSFGIRSCSECRFSNGGQFFAAMHSTIIHVYNTYTCDLLGHLRGHNGKVRSIFFVPPDDTRLITVGADGAVFEFSLTDFHKVNDHVIKAISYSSVTADNTTVWAVGNDRKLRQIERAHLAPQAEFDLKNCASMCLTLSPSLELLYAGCEDGTVRVFSTILAKRALADKLQHGTANDKEGQVDIHVETHVAHSSAVTRIALTYDEGLVASVGEDGMLTLWDVVAPGRATMPKKEIQMAEEILIDKKELEERTQAIQDLQNKVVELKQRMEHQQYKRELKHEEKILELKSKFSDEREGQQKQLENLMAAKNEQMIHFTEIRSDMEEKHRQDIEKIEHDYSAKIHALEEQASKLKLAIDDQRADFERKKAQRESEYGSALREQALSNEDAIVKEQDTISHLTDEKRVAEVDAEEICKLIEDETDVEIMKLKELYEQRMKFEQDQCAKLNGQNSIMKTKEATLKADLDAKKADILEKLKQQSNLHAQIKNFEKDIDALRHEMNERSATIGDKDKRIYDLKKKNQELEKFKFVLEYKIRELKSQIEPREEEIRQAHAKYAEMESEADRYLHNNEALVLQIRGLKLKLDGQQREIGSLKEKLTDAQQYESRLHTELTDLYEEKNPKRMKELTKVLYFKHTSTSQASRFLAERSTEDAQREYNRERDYLERTVRGLKRKLVKDSDTNRADRSRIMGENVTLLKEINELRREVRTLQMARRTTDGSPVRDDSAKELEMQRGEIARLRAKAEDLERQLHAAGRPVSLTGPPVVS